MMPFHQQTEKVWKDSGQMTWYSEGSSTPDSGELAEKALHVPNRRIAETERDVDLAQSVADIQVH